jgi:hypothetical protein
MIGDIDFRLVWRSNEYIYKTIYILFGLISKKVENELCLTFSCSGILLMEHL